MVERDLGTSGVEEEPPRIPGDGRETDIHPNDHIPEEEPSANDGLATVSWWYTHDAVVWWVETEGSCGETVRD